MVTEVQRRPAPERDLKEDIAGSRAPSPETSLMDEDAHLLITRPDEPERLGNETYSSTSLGDGHPRVVKTLESRDQP
jgi:hypothetical protein